jgi:hypothetical protein
LLENNNREQKAAKTNYHSPTPLILAIAPDKQNNTPTRHTAHQKKRDKVQIVLFISGAMSGTFLLFPSHDNGFTLQTRLEHIRHSSSI